MHVERRRKHHQLPDAIFYHDSRRRPHTATKKSELILEITILCHKSSHLFCSRHFYHHLRLPSWSALGGRRKKNHAALSLFFSTGRPDCISESLIRNKKRCLTNTSRPILIPSLLFFQSTDARPGIFPLSLSLTNLYIYFIDIPMRRFFSPQRVNERVALCAFINFYYLPLDGWILSSRRFMKLNKSWGTNR